MNGDAVVKVALGGAHLDGNGKSLQHLIRADADRVKTDDLLLDDSGVRSRGLKVADKLHGGASLSGGHGVVHVVEARGVDADVIRAETLTGLVLSETNSADGRVTEDDGGDEVVVEVIVWIGLGVVESLHETPSCSDGDGSEEVMASDVAESKDVRVGGLLQSVGDDVSCSICFHSCCCQVQERCAGLSSRCKEDNVEASVLLVMVDRLCFVIEPDIKLFLFC